MSQPKVEDIIHFMSLSDNIGTAGQPSEEQYPAIKAAGYEKVINLALTTSANALTDGRAIAVTCGLEYIHIPVLWEAPTHENLETFFAIMDTHKDHKVFVHCQVNYRVSAFMFLYRVIRQGVDPKSAIKTMHLIWYPERVSSGVWQKFIHDELARHGIEYQE